MSKHSNNGVSRLRSLIGSEPEQPAVEDEWARKILDARSKVQEWSEPPPARPITFSGRMALAGAPSSALDVRIDLDTERIEVRSDRRLIGSWTMDEVRITGADDGFHLFVEGEELLMRTDDDAEFALSIGLHSASPRMRRRISARLHEGPDDVDGAGGPLTRR